MKQHTIKCECIDTCSVWKMWKAHKSKYVKPRPEYQNDMSKTKDNYVSADLQKVIMLPRMDQFETAIFTRRLCLFNETFAEIGADKKNIGVLWHEGCAGRKDEEIASAYYRFLTSCRDEKEKIIWADN